jgi:hypothetical protein
VNTQVLVYDAPEETNPPVLLYKLKVGVPYILLVDAVKEPLFPPHIVLLKFVIETLVPLEI